MSPSLLFNLPKEILSDICHLVYWEHCSDLLEFALTSKQCYSIAKGLLYRTIKLDLVDSAKFATTVEQCREKLKDDMAFTLVRCLYITTEEMTLPTQPNIVPMPGQWRYPTFFRDYQDLEDYRDFTGYMKCIGRLRSQISISNATWQLLVDLITQLPALVDVHCVIGVPLPMLVLRAFDNPEKFYRLHHYDLDLRSLEAGMPDADLAALIRSPHLHAVHFGGVHQQNVLEAFTALVSDNTLAPNLKEFYLYLLGPADTPDSLPRGPPLQGLGGLLPTGQMTSHSSDRDKKHSLRSLIIVGSAVTSEVNGPLGSRTLDAALSQLKFLSLETRAASSTTRFLAQSNFSALRSLRLTCSVSASIEKDIQYYRNVKQFVQQLRQLKDLELIMWDFNMLGLAECLSPGLETLKLVDFEEESTFATAYQPHPRHLRPYEINLSESEISEIVHRCPEIRELHIQFRRSRGDAAEVGIYKLLGSLPKLRHLSLGLSAAPPPVLELDNGVQDTAIEPHFDDIGSAYAQRPYRKGHYRDALDNSAIDRKLAFYIFHAVSSGKASGSAPLQSLDVRVRECRAFCLNWLNDWLHGHIDIFAEENILLDGLRQDFLNVVKGAHPIHVSRDLREGHQDLVQIAQAKDIDWAGGEEYILDLNEDAVIVEEDILSWAIHSALWPERENATYHERSWWENWDSKPLSGYEDVWATAPYVPHSTAPTGQVFRAERGVWANHETAGFRDMRAKEFSKSVVRILDDRRYTCIWPESLDASQMHEDYWIK